MADIKWTWNFDVYDESDSPTEEGYYRIIDDEGNETTDYYFNEPRLTPNGIGYWRDGTRPIIAWRRIAEQTEPQIVDQVKADLEKRASWSKTYEAMCKDENSSEIPNNCEPQTKCETCKHHVEMCLISECNYEAEPQTDGRE